LVAVSKHEDPRLGFYTYVVNDTYADWPQGIVHDAFAIFAHLQDPGKLRIYDAALLAQGKKLELGGGYNTSDAFPSSSIRFPKHHGDSHGLTYILSADGSKLYAYAIKQPHMGTGLPPLMKSNAYKDPNGVDFGGIFDAVYQGNELYVTGDDGMNVYLWRIPVYPSKDGKSIVLDQDHSKKWALSWKTAGLKGGRKFDHPSVEVTSNNDVIIFHRAFLDGVNGVTETLYEVLYHGEDRFRQSRILKSTFAGGPRIDLTGSTLDLDGETVWTLRQYGNTGTVVLGSILP
jgi:hypothetical protein